MDIVLETKDYIKEKFTGEGTGHDWWHIKRVYDTSLRLTEQENNPAINREVVELAALLHDIADWKFNHGDDSAGPKAARAWLVSKNTDEETIHHVCTIIHDLSFKGAGTPTPMQTIEGQIVQDADRLDAIGAVGIARAFAYGGSKGRELFNPGILPKQHQTADEYKTQQSPTLNHFYEKLLLLKDRMNTKSGKAIARQRHAFMIRFLEAFLDETGETGSWHNRALATFRKPEIDH